MFGFKKYLKIMNNNDKKEFYEEFGNLNKFYRNGRTITGSIGLWLLNFIWKILVLVLLLGLTLKDYMTNYSEYVSGMIDIIFSLLPKTFITLMLGIIFGEIVGCLFVKYVFEKFISKKGYDVKLKEIELEKLKEDKN